MSNKNITFKDTSSNSLFPKTFTHLVYNTSNESLDNILSNMNLNISNKVTFSEDAVLSPSISPLNDYYNKSAIDTMFNNPTLTSSSVTINSKAGTKYVGAHICIESWRSNDNTQWYRKYSDGWKECGIYYYNSSTSPSGGNIEISMPITFSNTQYIVIYKPISSTTNVYNYEGAYNYTSKTTSKVYITINGGNNYGYNIYCCGY